MSQLPSLCPNCESDLTEPGALVAVMHIRALFPSQVDKAGEVRASVSMPSFSEAREMGWLWSRESLYCNCCGYTLEEGPPEHAKEWEDE